MKRLSFIKKEKGQILIETMVALAMVVIGLLGLLNLLSSSIGLNKVVSDQYVASYLTAEGIEIVKNIVDNNVANSDPYNLGLNPGTYEVDYNSTQLSGASPSSLRNLQFDENGTKKYTYLPTGPDPSATNFKRMITVSLRSGGDELVVQSEINWISRGGAALNVILEDHFYNWRP
jgi:type II secretory pathway pseudopilin PulG